MINTDMFFQGYKKEFGSLSLEKKDNLEYLLDRFNDSNVYDRTSKIAYTLATIKLETADSYAPVREGFYMNKGYMDTIKVLYNYYWKNNRPAIKTIFPYGIDIVNYVGRGYPQTTHIFNYEKHKRHILAKYGVNIVEDPEAMLDRDIAFDVMELGMCVREYSFTGKILEDYFNDETADYSLEKRFIGYKTMLGKTITPRRVINGTNEYVKIGQDAIKFYKFIDFK